MTIHARRHSPRFRLNEEAYIKLGSENSALVTDVSEAGLGFKVSSPLHDSGSINFRVTSGESEAVADLVWIDDTHLIGGIRFKDLPRDMRDQIRAWIDHSRGIAEVLPPIAPSVTTTDSFFDEVELSFLRSTVLETELEGNVSQPLALLREISQAPKVIAEPPMSRGRVKRSLTLFPAEAVQEGESASRTRHSPAGRRLALATLFLLVFFGAASVAAVTLLP
jgi:hypothetical protein